MSELAPAFTLAHARTAGLRKDEVYRLVDRGEIERIGRGVYLRPYLIDPAYETLAAATSVQPKATLCLTSALAHHDLTDMIPFAADVALPRSTRHPAGFQHATWHSFDRATFELGREAVELEGGHEVFIYSAQRTIIDCFRLMHQEGSDLAHSSIRRWLQVRGNSPAELIRTASAFPKALPRLRVALEVLL